MLTVGFKKIITSSIRLCGVKDTGPESLESIFTGEKQNRRSRAWSTVDELKNCFPDCRGEQYGILSELGNNWIISKYWLSNRPKVKCAHRFSLFFCEGISIIRNFLLIFIPEWEAISRNFLACDVALRFTLHHLSKLMEWFKSWRWWQFSRTQHAQQHNRYVWLQSAMPSEGLRSFIRNKCTLNCLEWN